MTNGARTSLPAGATLEALAGLVAEQPIVSFAFSKDGSSRWLSTEWAMTFAGELADIGSVVDLLDGRVHPEDRDRVDAFAVQCNQFDTAAGGAARTKRCVLRMRTGDGLFRWTELRCSVVEIGDGTAFVVGTLTDASEQHAAEVALADGALHANETNRIAAEFVSKMSHELRTPLHAILGYAQLLEMGAGDPTEYLRRLRRSGDHLVRLLDDLLDYSRLNAGHLPVRDDRFSLRPIVESALDMVAALAQGNDVTVVRDDEADVQVRGDATRLRQVIANLLTNAVKYNRPGGTVTVSTSLDGDAVTLDIADTGRGIAADVLPRLFQPFDRMGAEGSGVAGTGLGLPLSEGLVRSMGGDLAVASELDVGTRVRVTLRASALGSTAIDLREVVCIDDDAEARWILEAVLSRVPGTRVSVAATGARGLEIIERVQPSLVVLDRNLPDYSAELLLEAVVRVAPTCAVVVVSSDPVVLDPGFVRAPIVAAFSKPLDLDAFVDAIDALR